MIVTVDRKKLQQARIKKGLSQRGLARVAGVSALAINRLEQGNSTPRPSTLKKICDVIDVDILEICNIS